MQNICQVQSCSGKAYGRYALAVVDGAFCEWWRWAIAAGAAGVSRAWQTTPEGTKRMAIAVLLFFVVDTLLGSMRSVKAREFSSEQFRCAVTKVIVYMLAMVVGFISDWCFQLGSTVLLGMATVLVLAELSSIVENLHHLGIKVPAVLTQYLSTAQKAVDSGQSILPATSPLQFPPSDMGQVVAGNGAGPAASPVASPVAPATSPVAQSIAYETSTAPVGQPATPAVVPPAPQAQPTNDLPQSPI